MHLAEWIDRWTVIHAPPSNAIPAILIVQTHIHTYLVDDIDAGTGVLHAALELLEFQAVLPA